MTNRARQRYIVEALKDGEELTVKELAERFQTSEISVRRDLVQLAEKGQVTRTHGGAMKPDKAGFLQKDEKNLVAKAFIGELATEQVKNGDVIFMDCGSTVFQMCRHLVHLEKLTIITNSLPVVNELIGTPGFIINLVGGELDAPRMAVHGPTALEHIARYRANKTFVGVDGVSLTSGLTARSEKEASVTLAIANQADLTYLLCDSSKIEKDSYMKFAPLSLVNAIITDQRLSPAIKAAYVEKGLTILN